MEPKKYSKQKDNEISVPPLITLLVLVISMFLLIDKSLTVYAQEGLMSEYMLLREKAFDIDVEKERVSSGIKVITLKKEGVVSSIITTATTLEEILDQNDIYLTEKDYVSLSTAHIVNGTIIDIVRVEKLLVENIINIPFETKVVKTNSRRLGEEEVIQEGVLGVMIEKVMTYYEDGVLVGTEVIEENLRRDPIDKVVEIGTSQFSLNGITVRGYDCPYWYGVVDAGPYSEEEKKWLKYIMYCESGCNAESNKSSYKGLFQWSPYWWNKQFSENIFDGHAQILHTVEKYRAGESTRESQWPACNARYVKTYSN